MITVLLVDDHVHIRKAIWYLLETTRDIRVIATASNGAETVTAARFNHPDVVIMDISMPVMNGLDATRQILADFPRMRVLMLSSYDDQGHIQMAIETILQAMYLLPASHLGNGWSEIPVAAWHSSGVLFFRGRRIELEPDFKRQSHFVQ